MTDNAKTRFYQLRILEVIRETADASSFTFEVPVELEELFRYEAGQFLTFEVPWGGMQLRRSYSLASSPVVDQAMKVSVKRVEGGRISNWFNDEVEVGDLVRVQPPAGRFVLRERSDEVPLLLFAGGSGITPMMSLLKTALLRTARKVRLVYANRDAQSVIFLHKLLELQSEYRGRLEVVHHLDSVSGYMRADELPELVSGYEKADVYICGPAVWMNMVEEEVRELGFARDHLFVERFVSPMDPDRQRPEVVEARDEAAAHTDAATVSMTLAGETSEFGVEPGETILAAAMRQGIEVEYQCEEGYCGCCMARLREGEVTMPLHDALSDDEVEEGWILTCQARPKSSRCSVDYDAGF